MIEIAVPLRRFWNVFPFLLIMATCLIAPCIARATPEFAKREGRACQYCHKNPSPGYVDPKTNEKQGAERNDRGIYYAAHDHTFQGFVEKGMEKQIIPRFHWAWNAPATTTEGNARRLAVGDVTGDGKLRLVLLNEQPGDKKAGTLVVKKWNGKTFITEFTGEVQAGPDQLAVGKFAGENKPALIVTSDALWAWDGKTFVRHASGRPLHLLGTTQLKSGGERLLVAESAASVKAYRVSPTAPAGNWLVEAIDAPGPTQVTFGDMHADPTFFSEMGLPPQLASGGLIGLWRWPGHDHLYVYYARINTEFEVKPGVENKFKLNDPSGLEVVGSTCQISLTEPQDPNAPQVWATPNLDGIIFDTVPLDPRTGKPGLLILSGDKSGKTRMLSFFALDAA